MSISLENLWRDQWAGRQDWAFRAYDAFRDGLSEHTRSCLTAGSTEASVVLFGRTQVGKTTLLLRLLGVSEQAAARVSTLLRGGRGAGQSATSTAMRYRRSDDDLWRIDSHGENGLDDDGLCQALATLRAQVEAGNGDVGVVTVSIPAKYFTPRKEGQTVRILDLPGDNPANQAEARHVTAVATEYVPKADLVLIVGRADDLSFLNPRAFTLPGIRDWRYTPERFRIITTYSFSPRSLVKWIMGQAEPSPDLLRERLLQQIATHGIELAPEAKRPRLYFPLEFGQSWADVRRKEPALYDKAHPAIERLMEDLEAAIIDAAHPLSRLKHARAAHVLVERIRNEEYRILEDENKILSKKLQESVNSVVNAEEKVEREKIALEALSSFSFSKEGKKLIQDQAYKSISQIKIEKPTTNTNSFLEEIRIFCDKIAGKSMEFYPEKIPLNLKNPLGGGVGEIRKIADDQFSDILSTIDGYFINEYFPSISDDYERDWGTLQLSMSDAWKNVSNFVAKKWGVVLTDYSRQVASRREQAEASWHSLRSALTCLERQKEDSEAKLQCHKDKMGKFLREMEEDAQRGREFHKIMTQALVAEISDRRAEICRNTSSVQKFIRLLGAVAVCDESRTLLDL